MLVLCVGMYRACSTWQYGVAGAIVEKHRGGRRLGFIAGVDAHEKLDAREAGTGWGLLKAHDAHERFGELLRSGQALGLASYRDLRAVVASYMHKTGTDFDTLMDQGFVELCLHNDRFWREQPGVLVQSYEALIADPVRGVAEIADHLGVVLPAGEAEAIAGSMSWEANRRKVAALSAQFRQAGTALAPTDQSRFDPVSLLHWNHIRAADPRQPDRPAGTTRERGLIERLAGRWLVDHGYHLDAAPAPADLAPMIRTSYAPQGVDLRLDRLWPGVKSTAVDFDATFPRAANLTYRLYRRGWKTISIGTTAADRGRFVIERPTDLNLAWRFDPSSAVASLAALIASKRIADPDVVAFNPASDVDSILGAIGATSWRPRVYLVDQAEMPPKSPWQARLERMGYRAVPDLTGPQIYLRADCVASLAMLAAPLGPADGLPGTEPQPLAGDGFPSAEPLATGFRAIDDPARPLTAPQCDHVELNVRATAARASWRDAIRLRSPRGVGRAALSLLTRGVGRSAPASRVAPDQPKPGKNPVESPSLAGEMPALASKVR